MIKEQNSSTLYWQGGPAAVGIHHPSNVPRQTVNKAISILEGFRNECQKQWVAFFAAARGIEIFHSRFLNINSESSVGTSRISFGSAFPDSEQLPGKSTIAAMTEKDFLEALGPRGEFENQQAKIFVVFMFHLWEDNYRDRISDSFSISKNLVKCDLMGDIRHIRNSIIHQDSDILQNELNNLKMLLQIWNIQLGKLKISNEMIHALMEQINAVRITIKSDS